MQSSLCIAGSASIDSNNHRSKIFEKKNSRKFQKAKLEFAVLATVLCLHCIRYYKESRGDFKVYGRILGYMKILCYFFFFLCKELEQL